MKGLYKNSKRVLGLTNVIAAISYPLSYYHYLFDVMPMRLSSAHLNLIQNSFDFWKA